MILDYIKFGEYHEFQLYLKIQLNLLGLTKLTITVIIIGFVVNVSYNVFINQWTKFWIFYQQKNPTTIIQDILLSSNDSMKNIVYNLDYSDTITWFSRTNCSKLSRVFIISTRIRERAHRRDYNILSVVQLMNVSNVFYKWNLKYIGKYISKYQWRLYAE